MNIELAKLGTVALIIQSEDGRIRQLAITVEQSDLLLTFLSVLSKQEKLILMNEDHDLVLKSTLCKKCKNK